MTAAFEIAFLQPGSEETHLAGEWDALRRCEDVFVPPSCDLRQLAMRPDHAAILVAERPFGKTTSIAGFVCARRAVNFTAGRKRLLSLNANVIDLFGNRVLGEGSSASIAKLIQFAMAQFPKADLFSTGEIPVDSKLFEALRLLGQSNFVVKGARKDAVHWLIKLPESAEQYLAGLSANTRQNLRREVRIFLSGGGHLSVIDSTRDVNAFLKDAEFISRKTYQWRLGARLYNDKATSERFIELAERKELKCYLLYFNEKPCAFARGRLVEGVFHFESTGYDPELSKLSPGAVLLYLIVENLISSKNARVFDFGSGGDNVGYKSRFGTDSFVATSLLVANSGSLRGWIVLSLRRYLSLFLNLTRNLSRRLGSLK